MCQVNPFADTKYNPIEAEAVVLFLLGALSDLGEI